LSELLKRFYAKPWLTTELLVSSLVINILGLASAMYIMQVLSRYVSYGIDATLYTLTSGVIIAMIFDFMFRGLRLRLATGLYEETERELSESTFESLTNIKVQALNQLDSGFQREILSGLNTIRSAYSPVNLVSLLDLPFATIYMAAIFLLAPTVGLVAIFFATLVLLATILMQRRSYGTNQRLMEEASELQKLAQTAMVNPETVRAFNSEKHLRSRWGELLDRLGGVQSEMNQEQGRSQSLTFSFVSLLSICVIFVAATKVVNMEIGIGTMIGCNILASKALSPITRFATLSLTFSRAAVSINLLKTFSQMPKEKSEGIEVKSYDGAIALKEVSFKFPNAPLALFKSLSFEVKAGEFVVVSGPNGAGKTTLTRMLMGLIEPQRGQVLIQGADLRQLNLSKWREQVIFLPQEPQFFEGTLRENLERGMPVHTEERIYQSLKMVGMSTYVEQNPKGLDMLLLGGGQNLSLGQRRRMAMARALLTEGPLAVIDELTEGMDQASSQSMFQVMGALRKAGKTILLFTHLGGDRFPKADRVIQIGKVQQKSDPESLDDEKASKDEEGKV
jgi:ATP-binding cassette, subfamily C, bacterial LapB